MNGGRRRRALFKGPRRGLILQCNCFAIDPLLGPSIMQSVALPILSEAVGAIGRLFLLDLGERSISALRVDNVNLSGAKWVMKARQA